MIIKKSIIIEKICNDDDNDNENDNISSISLVLRLTGQFLFYIFFKKNSKHLKLKQKHFK